MKLQVVSAQILTKQSDRASPNSVILTAAVLNSSDLVLNMEKEGYA